VLGSARQPACNARVSGCLDVFAMSFPVTVFGNAAGLSHKAAFPTTTIGFT
jgi:hypothetical protein